MSYHVTRVTRRVPRAAQERLTLPEHLILHPVLEALVLLATGRWLSPGTPVSATNKTDRHDITEIFLNVALNTITLILNNLSFIQLSIIS
jgi:hypothetical protein